MAEVAACSRESLDRPVGSPFAAADPVAAAAAGEAQQPAGDPQQLASTKAQRSWSCTPALPALAGKSGCVRRALRKVRLLVKILGIGAMLAVMPISLLAWPAELIESEVARRRVMSALFAIGLFLVAVEDVVRIDKSAVMLILAAAMWVFTAAGYHPRTSQEGYEALHEQLNKGLEDVGSIVLFLLPAMGVVESIDHYGGFTVVTYGIQVLIHGRQDLLMPVVCLLCFFMSAVIDNLTATIVALKILRHIVPQDHDRRRLCGGLAVIAANAGGAWSPIGDVTTTMLWVQGKITATSTVRALLFPSFVAGVFPLAGLWWQARAGATEKLGDMRKAPEIRGSSLAVLVLGVLSILMVPVLKMWTGLPPYLGMLLALGAVWVISGSVDLGAHAEQVQDVESASPADEGHGHGGVPAALHKVDLTGLLFFTGVLLAVVALDAAGVLRRYATFLADHVGKSPTLLCSLLGVSSAVVDNVPLVQAAIEMFRKTPVDDPLWQLVALAAGTGGSILSIGSIAGVTFMGMEGVGFLWYFRKISLWAALGVALGICVYDLQRMLISP